MMHILMVKVFILNSELFCISYIRKDPVPPTLKDWSLNNDYSGSAGGLAWIRIACHS